MDSSPGSAILDLPFIARRPRRVLPTSFTGDVTLKLAGMTGDEAELDPHVTPGPGIEPGPKRWEASALTTAPSLLPCMYPIELVSIRVSICFKVSITPKNVFHLVQFLYGISKNAAKIFSSG